MKVIYQNNDMEIREYTMEEYIDIPIYGDQREVDEQRVNDLVEYQQQYFEKNDKFDIITPPLIAINTDGKTVFMTKNNIESDEVLFDGQHRLCAFQYLYNIYKDNPFINRHFLRQKIIVHGFYCDNNNIIHDLFINVNKSVSASGMELQKNKQNYNIHSTLKKAIKAVLKNREFKQSDKENIIKTKCETFYLRVFEEEIISNIELQNILLTYRINANSLFKIMKRLNIAYYDKIMNKANITLFSGTSQAWKRDLNCFVKNKKPINPNHLYFKYIHPKQYHYIINDFIKELKDIYHIETGEES